MADEEDTELQNDPGAVPGVDDKSRQGGINQGQGSGAAGEMNDSDPADEELRRRRQAKGDLFDDNAASHQGGFGAQSGQADYGSAGNLAGTDNVTPKPGSNPK